MSTSRSLDTSETDISSSSLKISQVPEELLNPESSSLSNSGELGRLEVGESKSGKVSVLLGECRKTRDDDGELGKEDGETFPEEDEVGVADQMSEQSIPTI